MARLTALSAACVALCAGAGCREAPVVDVRLAMLGGMELGPRSRLVVRRDDGRVLIDSGTVRSAQLLSGHVIDASALAEDERYFVDLIADALPGACTKGTGRLVGRSLPFVHDSDGETVHVPVGCGDELGETASMANARVLHHAVATDDGHVIVSGGSQEVVLRPTSSEPISVTRFPATIDRYDVATSTFTEIDMPQPPTPRLMATGLLLADGSIVSIGGILGTPESFRCHPTYDRIWPPERMEAELPLIAERCLPTAVRALDAVIVSGAGSGPAPAIEMHDPTMDADAEPQPAGLASEGALQTVLVETPHGALLLGAPPVEEGGATVRDVRSDGGSVTVTPFAASMAASLPLEDWHDFAAVYVPCDGGGPDRLGSVYVTGGMDAALTDDIAWCIPVTGAGYGAPQVFTGALNGPRANHRTVLVPGRAGPRILVIPGARARQGEILGIAGCTCAPPGTRDDGATERVVQEFPSPAGLIASMVTYQDATATPLPDGSVLVTGVSLASDELADLDPDDPDNALEPVFRLAGSRNAYLFLPDVIPEAIE